jgi:hypothetical protein
MLRAALHTPYFGEDQPANCSPDFNSSKGNTLSGVKSGHMTPAGFKTLECREIQSSLPPSASTAWKEKLRDISQII